MTIIDKILATSQTSKRHQVTHEMTKWLEKMPLNFCIERRNLFVTVFSE